MNVKFWSNYYIVITGTSSGIGAALLEKLKSTDCTIFALDRQPGKDHSGSLAKVIPILCDLSVEADIERSASEILKHTDRIDVLFNNAGITAHGRFDQTDFTVFKKTFSINFFGTVYLTRLLIEPIKKSAGAILTTSTVSGLYGIPGRSAYSSSKAALHAVFESIRIELSELGVRSIIFCPPYTKTNLRTSGLAAGGETLNEAQHSGNLKTPEEVAEEMMKAVEKPSSRLVMIDKSGRFVNWMRVISPRFLEKVLFKKLYKDFH
jgi:NAD(P)-dependent dehydrogenase (short-subunit alcohol dehydrogenase family)